ncbi:MULTISPECIES: TetR/AcrR family transcriptional regulator [unclassified Streptomyces]|uniref:TetR/AcrR family transcriptional regulator n=1 Tax=unclassified Streptomyces TaxID=2593676 RepID=UPI0025547525|nr:MULTISPECIES: TetR/AcrR family transcriptional regulator [unclassified Streptomyces]WRZ69110.1 TetR/AcrR family transcriptional regulator [Streptomyces sp. NBC_01257]
MTKSPRAELVHRKVLDAAATLLAELGYLELTMDKVAVLAGVTRKTVYHRWPHKAALVGELLISQARVEAVPDHGDTRLELRSLLDMVLRDVRGEGGAILPALWANMGDPSVMERFRHEVLLPRRQNARAVIQRGIARGDIPADVDADLLIDTWSGVAMFRTEVRSDAFLPEQVDELVDLVMTGRVPRIRPRTAR